VPPAQRPLAQELPQPLDQIQVRRVRRQRLQLKLRMPAQLVLHHWRAIIPGAVQVQDKAFRLRMRGP
jgi:hypothetical protein